MKIRLLVRSLSGALLVGLTALAYQTIAAQTTTGTVRGYITNREGQALPGVEVLVRNTQTGVQRTTSSKTDGGYTLPGLTPGIYDLTVRQIGRAPETRRIQVQIGATLLLDFQLEERAVALAELEVVAQARPVVETRTSEVATNVTQQQINDLPTAGRNFLDLGALAPGVTVQNDLIGATGRKTISFGAQGPDQINVFIDGASYKNDILRGGVVGQDRSRGNPFPRNAIQEFRIITQNYKAEYQKSSSGIITATTRSGGNTWEGQAFFNYQDKGLVALDSITRRNSAGNPDFVEPEYERYLGGLAIGGPIIRDRLHFFGSYEGNYQNRAFPVTISPPTGFPVLDTFNLASLSGAFGAPFRSTLLFGKLSYAATPNSTFELSGNWRNEHDIRNFGGDRAFDIAVRFKNKVETGILKHRYVKEALLNEATASYQRYSDDHTPNAPGSNTYFFCCNFSAWTGSDPTFQDFNQKRLALRNDITYSGLQDGKHVLKAGVSLDFVRYDIVKRNSENPLFVFTDGDGFAIPEKVEFQFGDPNYGDNNAQLGVYLQDDWSPTPRLTINAGIRWDYETNMINDDYVTPSDVVDSLTKYETLLFLPLEPERHFTDGDDRSQFKGAIQPRLGLSYQLDRQGRTTIFGGWGLFYDRSVYDLMQQEKEALQHPMYRVFFRRFPGDETDPNKVDWDPAYLSRTPGQIIQAAGPQAAAREVKLLPNDLKPPRSHQFSAGIRQLVGSFAFQGAYTGVRSSNVFTFYWANRDFPCGNGTCFTENPIPGFGPILFGTNAGKTWYDAFQLQIDRPYQRSDDDFGWGFGLAGTLAKRQTEGFNDDFSHPNGKFYPKQVRNDERVRIVTHWLLDLPFLYGIQFSGLITLGSGQRYDVGDRFAATGTPELIEFGGFTPDRFNFLIPNAWAYRTVDLRLRKDFPSFGRTRVGVTADLFNAFNYENLGCFNTGNRADPNFGQPNCVTSDPRRFQIGAELSF